MWCHLLHFIVIITFQLSQVPHKKTFFYLEQLILRHNAHTNTVRVKQESGGLHVITQLHVDTGRGGSVQVWHYWSQGEMVRNSCITTSPYKQLVGLPLFRFSSHRLQISSPVRNDLLFGSDSEWCSFISIRYIAMDTAIFFLSYCSGPAANSNQWQLFQELTNYNFALPGKRA